MTFQDTEVISAAFGQHPTTETKKNMSVICQHLMQKTCVKNNQQVAAPGCLRFMQ